MMINTIALPITLFIAACAALHLWINRPRGLIAGEYIGRGSFVYLRTDGKAYNAVRYTNPVGIIMEDQEPETECYTCKNVTTTMVHTHGIDVCPDCTRRIVRNHVADLMANET